MLWTVVLIALAAVVALVLFGPWFKGRRTQIFGWLVGIWGAAVPMLSEIITVLQGLDWRQYILAGDQKNLAVLGIMAAFAVITVVLRHMTTGPVGSGK